MRLAWPRASGGVPSRAASSAFLRAAREIASEGTFTFAEQAVPFAQMNAMFKTAPRS